MSRVAARAYLLVCGGALLAGCAGRQPAPDTAYGERQAIDARLAREAYGKVAKAVLLLVEEKDPIKGQEAFLGLNRQAMDLAVRVIAACYWGGDGLGTRFGKEDLRVALSRTSTDRAQLELLRVALYDQNPYHIQLALDSIYRGKGVEFYLAFLKTLERGDLPDWLEKRLREQVAMLWLPLSMAELVRYAEQHGSREAQEFLKEACEAIIVHRRSPKVIVGKDFITMKTLLKRRSRGLEEAPVPSRAPRPGPKELAVVQILKDLRLAAQRPVQAGKAAEAQIGDGSEAAEPVQRRSPASDGGIEDGD